MTLDWIAPTDLEEREHSSFLIGELLLACIVVTAAVTLILLVLTVWFGLGA